MMVTRFSRLITAAAAGVIGVLVLGSAVGAQTEPTPLGTVSQRIVDRGELICGVNNVVTGFGFQDASGAFSGFDVDFCRAVAAALLGDATKVAFRPVEAGERQAVIQNAEVDLMARNTTVTISRDIVWGATFGPTTFYDGQGVMTLASLGVSTIAELDGTTMCVQTGTTTQLNITDYISANGLNIELLTFDSADPTWEAYIAGRCESWTTDKSGLASYRTRAANPNDHVILAETLSKEPLAPLSPQGDEQFAEIVRWVAFGLIQAEEFGINSGNVTDYLLGADETPEAYTARVKPEIQRFLGQNNNASGSYLGIANDFMVTVITQVGNYGEIYDRNLVPLGLVRAGSPNALWTEGGLLYSPPFR
jgi:general L-amino acid transport system substrate-binding protein